MARPLTRTERRLQERVQPLLAPDEKIQAALYAHPRLDARATRVAKIITVILAGFGHPDTWTRPCAIALTDRGVVRFRHNRLGRPVAEAQRYPLSDLGPFETTGLDFWFDLAGHRYTVTGDWNSEHTKMRRLREQAP
jgi:hypothetical protein